VSVVQVLLVDVDRVPNGPLISADGDVGHARTHSRGNYKRARADELPGSRG
jgi:hypothetical protein